jgi:hypothetical protein
VRCHARANARTPPSPAIPDPTSPVNRDVAAETEAYQALLEGHRACPDDEELYLDMLKAKAAMEIAWLKAAPTAE